MKKLKCDYLVVGAGLFGATVARELTDAGYKVIVIDRRSHVAGNIYTEKISNIDVHVYGAHIFHTSNERVYRYVLRFAKLNDFINSPLSFYKGEYYNLPFNMHTFAKLFNITTPEEAKKIIEAEKKQYHVENPKNLEEQAINLVGKTVYETLIKGYTEKQWGKPCTELPPSIIKRIPVRFEYNNNYFDDIYQGIPEDGYTKMVGNMLEGIEVHLNEEYETVKDKYLATKIIYTGPIDKYYNYCFGQLAYRSLRFDTECLDINSYQDHAVINYADIEVPYTRIIEHKYFVLRENQKGTIITKEYPSKWIEGAEPYYPINDNQNNQLYEKYCELSKKDNNVIFGGRLGLYKYLDMDDVILEALKLADTLLKRSV